MLIRSLACLSLLSLSACAYEAPSNPDEVTPLVNAPSDDRGTFEVVLTQDAQRSFSFDCTQRCDVELRLDTSVESGTASTSVALAYLQRPNGLTRNETIDVGQKTLTFSQLAPGTYTFLLASAIESTVRVRLAATWLEGANALPGGAVRVVLADMPSSRAEGERTSRASMTFDCEEANGCDLDVWTQLATVKEDTDAAAEYLASREGVELELVDPEGFSGILADTVSNQIGASHVGRLSRGVHTIEASVSIPQGEALRALTASAEWYPADQSPLDRLNAFFRAREAALGCGSPGPDAALAASAQSHAVELARADASEDWQSEPLTDTPGALELKLAVELPVVADIVSAFDADSDVVSRLGRCERWGLGRANAQSGKTYLTLQLAP